MISSSHLSCSASRHRSRSTPQASRGCRCIRGMSCIDIICELHSQTWSFFQMLLLLMSLQVLKLLFRQIFVEKHEQTVVLAFCPSLLCFCVFLVSFFNFIRTLFAQIVFFCFCFCVVSSRCRAVLFTSAQGRTSTAQLLEAVEAAKKS